MKIYFVYKETQFFRLYKFLFLFKKDNILYWKRDKSNSSRNIPFPDNAQFYSLLKEARAHLETHYSTMVTTSTDQHLIDYLKKHISYTFADYYFFRRAVYKQLKSYDKYKIIGPRYLSDIYEKESINTNPLLIFSYLFFAIIALPRFLKNIYYCFVQKEKVKVPDVMYYRKKILPVPFGLSRIKNSFNNKGILCEGVFLQFSRIFKKYGICFLSSFSNSTNVALSTVIRVYKFAYVDVKYFYIYTIPGIFFFSYLQNSFNALMVINLEPKIIFGVLEKHPFILLSRYKREWQKICSFSDGFIYEPIVSIDYCYSDIFYTMNKIEIDNINANGGHIREVKEVGNIRSYKLSTSKGLSEELKNKIKKYSYKILVTTNKVDDEVYFPLNQKGLKTFVDEIVTLAINNPESLFIIKSKKGELKIILKKCISTLSSLDNVYIIYSDVPTLLEYDQFEDLIKISSLLISMCFWSTTVWQAISYKVPVIACNNEFASSFMCKYRYLEVKYDEIKESFHHWKNVNKLDFESFLTDIDLKTNVLKRDAFKVMIEDMSNLVTNL